MPRSVVRLNLQFSLIIFIITSFAWLSLVTFASADNSLCKLPSQTASQFCLGSTGVITVSSETDATCIPGCTYSVTDVGDKKQISASYSESYCTQYRSYVSYKGSSKDCYPGADAQEVVQRSSPFLNQNMSQVAPESGLSSPKNINEGTSDTRKEITTADLSSMTLPVNTAAEDECQNSLLSLMGVPCGSDQFEDSAHDVEESTGIEELFQQAGGGDAMSPTSPEASEPVMLNGKLESGAFSAISPDEHVSGSGMSSELQLGAPAVTSVDGQRASPKGWFETMWGRLIDCGLSGLLNADNCRTSSRKAAVAAAAAASQSDVGETGLCRGGGDVFVYTKDMSGMSNDPNRSAELERFQCYGPHFGNATSNGRSKLEWIPLNIRARMNLKEFQILSSDDVCKVLKGREWNCAVLYYAVVADLEKTRVGGDLPAKVVSRQCNPQYVAQGQLIQFGMCAFVEKQIREEESQFARNSVNLNPQQNNKLFGLDWSNVTAGITRPGDRYPNSGLPNTKGTAFTIGVRFPF